MTEKQNCGRYPWGDVDRSPYQIGMHIEYLMNLGCTNKQISENLDLPEVFVAYLIEESKDFRNNFMRND